ncbi:hypothetical protein Tco_1184541 [Tanacetum coccineum]
MVLQLTDFTSEITDEELREFTSEYYIPFALHPVVPAASASIADFPEGKVGVYTRFFEFANQRVPLSLFMCNVLNHYRLHISQLHCIGAAKITNFEVNCRLLAINPTVHLFRAFYHTSWSNGWVSFSKRAGRLQCYTEKLDALRRWREMFFWVDDALVPWDFAFYTQGSLPRDERPPPGSYSMEDAELINENRIPINAYSEAFLCHMGISRNYFRSPEEVPTFIGDDGREMDLFSVVHLSKPKLVTEGVRPLRDGEEPLLESTAGRTMELVLEQPEVENSDHRAVSDSTKTKPEYVSLSACCAQVLWLRTQLTDYGFHFDKIPMYCDSKAAIAISCNPVQHSCTKHIDVRYHFIKEHVEKGIVELFFVGTEYQLADLFTKALSEDRFKYLVRRLGMRCLTPDELEVLAIESA